MRKATLALGLLLLGACGQEPLSAADKDFCGVVTAGDGHVMALREEIARVQEDYRWYDSSTDSMVFSSITAQNAHFDLTDGKVADDDLAELTDEADARIQEMREAIDHDERDAPESEIDAADDALTELVDFCTDNA